MGDGGPQAPEENATVEVHPDGTATILTGTSPHGQGHATAWAMLASEELGIPVDKITLKRGDTDLVPQGGDTGGSASLHPGGSRIEQGAAQAFLEEVVYDGDGNPLTASFADYPFLSATEVPSFELADMQTLTSYNPLGVKGIGEAGTIGATPAVQNAVVDALAHLGVRHVDMPASPQRVWEALQAAGASWPAATAGLPALGRDGEVGGGIARGSGPSGSGVAPGSVGPGSTVSPRANTESENA